MQEDAIVGSDHIITGSVKIPFSEVLSEPMPAECSELGYFCLYLECFGNPFAVACIFETYDAAQRARERIIGWQRGLRERGEEALLT